jgi:hypothetical protein
LCAAELGRDETIGNGEAEIVFKAVLEIFPVIIGLEADKIIGQHRRDNFAVIWCAEHRRPVAPGRMQEKADRLYNSQPSQLHGQRQEVIVLHPVDGVRLCKAQQRARHEGVDRPI